uniref:Uncharacterized protein n=1 Tax=Rhizophora mucronata TaxID=61149 RepID=A0A2P2J4D9_RHIMU
MIPHHMCCVQKTHATKTLYLQELAHLYTLYHQELSHLYEI